MHRIRAVLGIILALVGLVWIGQGTGLLKGGSFMVGDARWAIIGAVLVVAGLGLLVWSVRRVR
jgi:hypothetical protein